MVKLQQENLTGSCFLAVCCTVINLTPPDKELEIKMILAKGRRLLSRDAVKKFHLFFALEKFVAIGDTEITNKKCE